MNFSEEQLRKIIREEIRDEVRPEIDEIRETVDVLRDSMFRIENDYFNKFDALYDYIMLQKEMNNIKNENVSKVQKLVEQNSLKILNHDIRIESIENKLNQSI